MRKIFKQNFFEEALCSLWFEIQVFKSGKIISVQNQTILKFYEISYFLFGNNGETKLKYLIGKSLQPKFF